MGERDCERLEDLLFEESKAVDVLYFHYGLLPWLIVECWLKIMEA
jgi:hypothetical protein